MPEVARGNYYILTNNSGDGVNRCHLTAIDPSDKSPVSAVIITPYEIDSTVSHREIRLVPRNDNVEEINTVLRNKGLPLLSGSCCFFIYKSKEEEFLSAQLKSYNRRKPQYYSSVSLEQLQQARLIDPELAHAVHQFQEITSDPDVLKKGTHEQAIIFAGFANLLEAIIPSPTKG